MRRWLIAAAIGLVILLLGATSYLASRDTPAQTNISQPATVAVTRGDVQQLVTAAGQLVNTRQATLSMGTSGQLAKLEVRPGDRVKQGQVLAALDVPAEPTETRGDPAQLRRAIGNIVDNAIKFTPEGGSITIDLSKNGAVIEVFVQDTGIGVPAEDLPQLFSRFHRGRNAANYPGNGLGLAIVKAIAEVHGGSVSAANTSPGARFCLAFPKTY